MLIKDCLFLILFIFIKDLFNFLAMDYKEFELIYKREDKHWWYVGMLSIMRTLIEFFYNKSSNLRILDAGCGTGGVFKLLSEYGHIIGMDISEYAIYFSQKRGHKNLIRGSVIEMPFKDRSFNLITAFDLLYYEHIDDEQVLEEIFRILTSDGRLILRVPAYNWLRGIHDIKVSTGHRYTLKELKFKLIKTGFIVEFISYINTILFPFIALKRISEKIFLKQKTSDLAIDFKGLNGIFKKILCFEAYMIKKISLPFGLSIVAVGRK